MRNNYPDRPSAFPGIVGTKLTTFYFGIHAEYLQKKLSFR